MPDQEDSIGQDQQELSFRRKRLCIAAVIAAIIHLIAGVCMIMILRHGLDTTTDLTNRLMFMTDNRPLWVMGWSTWNAAALSIVFFYFSFAELHAYAGDAPVRILRIAVLIAVTGMVLDLGAEIMEMSVLPDLARNILNQSYDIASRETEIFLSTHRTAVIMTGCLANGLYTLSAALLIFATRNQYKWSVQAAGWAVIVGGVWLSIASFANSVLGMVYANILLLPALLIWQISIARENMTDSKR